MKENKRLIPFSDCVTICLILQSACKWTEVDGAVICDSGWLRRHGARKALLKGEAIEVIEATFNHCHMSMLMGNFDCSTYEWSNVMLFAETLAAVWFKSASDAFPDKRFHVRCEYEKNFNGDIDDVVVTLTQVVASSHS